ncbi:three-Cys-motif partner protein TcmP [Chloroflexota bacterium]
MELKPRDVQTQVKHMILDKYLRAWGGIILNGLKGPAARMQSRGRRLGHHFIYVDCFSYVGRYSGNTEDVFMERAAGPVPGSPLIGIRALDSLIGMAYSYGIDLRVNSILIEEDPRLFQGLLDTLSDEGLAHRVSQTIDFSGLGMGEIAVVNSDCTQVADRLLDLTRQRFAKAFYLLDPYGSSGIPYDFVHSIVQSEGHDVMINFPYYDLHKKTGSIHTPSHQAHIDHWTKAFGTAEWIKIGQEIEQLRTSRDALLDALGLTISEAEGDPIFAESQDGLSLTDKQLTALIEGKLVDLYRTVLVEMDAKLTVKTIRLSFPDKERPMFYLFLTTHDPTGALRLNEILSDAKLWEYELRYKRDLAKKSRPPQDQLSFPFLKTMQPPIPEPETPDRPSIEQCAQDIMRVFSGRTATRRDVYRELADGLYFPTEVDKAIRHLKKETQAIYEGRLSHDVLIEFR